MKDLIVTADDFGASAEINRAVARAHREGILTSASLMVNEPAFEEAVALARAAPSLAVGLHLALSLSRPTLPRERIPDLVDAEGRLPDNSTRAGWRYYFSRRLRPQLEREVRAQIEKFLATGLPLDHVNGHQHLHMHPRVFATLVGCAREYGIGGVRIVRDDLRLNLRLDRGRWGYKLSHAATFGVLGCWCRRMARGTACATADRVWGLYQDGHLTREPLLGMLRRLPPGVTEIYSHPSLGRGEKPERRPDLEFEALIDPEVKRAVGEAGARLTAYGRLRRPA